MNITRQLKLAIAGIFLIIGSSAMAQGLPGHNNGMLTVTPEYINSRWTSNVNACSAGCIGVNMAIPPTGLPNGRIAPAITDFVVFTDYAYQTMSAQQMLDLQSLQDDDPTVTNENISTRYEVTLEKLEVVISENGAAHIVYQIVFTDLATGERHIVWAGSRTIPNSDIP